MNKNAFAVLVSKKEKGKKEVNIAQIKEIMRVMDKELNGIVYRAIELKAK